MPVILLKTYSKTRSESFCFPFGEFGANVLYIMIYGSTTPLYVCNIRIDTRAAFVHRIDDVFASENKQCSAHVHGDVIHNIRPSAFRLVLYPHLAI